MASALTCEKFELQGWQSNKEYSKVLRLRNDGVSSLKFIYYIVGSYFQTEYTGSCFLPPGLQFKIHISFKSSEKVDIIEKLVIKTVEGLNKEVELRAIIFDSEIDILEQEMKLGRILCFEEQYLVAKIFNKGLKSLSCTLKIDAILKEFELLAGLNEVVFQRTINSPGTFMEELELNCAANKYIIKVTGYAELPRLKINVMDFRKSSPTIDNFFKIEIENLSFKTLECNYFANCPNCKIKVSEALVFRSNTPTTISIPYTPLYFNSEYECEILFKFNDYVIFSSIHILKSAKALVSCVSENIVVFVDLDKVQFITEFLVLRNESDFPICAHLFCDMEEFEIEETIFIDRKEHRKVPFVFRPKYPCFFNTFMTVIVQGSDPLKVNLTCHAKSLKSFRTDLCIIPKENQAGIYFEPSNSENGIELEVTNNTNCLITMYLPTQLTFRAFSIQTRESLNAVLPHSKFKVSFEIQSHSSYYQYIMLHFTTNEELYFYPLLLFSSKELKLPRLLEKCHRSADSQYLWGSQASIVENGVLLDSNIFPKIINNLSKRFWFAFQTAKPKEIEALQNLNLSVKYESEHIAITNMENSFSSFVLSFGSALLENYSIFPESKHVTLVPYQVITCPILAVQRRRFKDNISIFINGKMVESFEFLNPLCFIKGDNTYEGLGPEQCIHHILFNKLKLNKECFNKRVGVFLPIQISSGQVSVSLEHSSKLLNGTYFEDYVFSEKEKKMMNEIKNKNCEIVLTKLENNYLIKFYFTATVFTSYEFKATICVKNNYSVEQFKIEYQISVLPETENSKLLESYCQSLQCPPADSNSLKLVNYFSNIVDHYMIKTEDLFISTNFNLLWLGICPCNNESRIPLCITNKTNKTLDLEIKSQQLHFRPSNLALKPHSTITVTITLRVNMMPSLFAYSAVIEFDKYSKNIFIGGLAASWIDTNTISSNNCSNLIFPENTSEHFQTLNDCFVNDISAMLYSSMIDPVQIQPTIGTSVVEPELHFQMLSKLLLDDIMSIF